MPARQRGSTVRRGRTWAARWRDENDEARFRGGFNTKTEARAWLDCKMPEVEALRDGDLAALRRQDMPTLQELVDEYLAQHVCEPNTKATLTARLRYATAKFGAVRLDRLAVSELRAWRTTLPAGSAWHIVKALRQLLGYAVAVGLLDTNPAKAIPNPEPKRTEILPFATLAEVEAVSAELLQHYAVIPLVGTLTGLRPSELLALERRDVDREAKVLHVRRVLIGGQLRPYGKTTGALRVVPLAKKALEALEAHPARIDTTLLFSTQRGTSIDLHRWRSRHWTPALRAAGLPHRGPYAMRHTFASWAIAAGLPTFEIAATMGTSLEQLSKTYAHLLPDSADRARVALDAFLATPVLADEARAE
jgi:integrase